ncbi:MAG: hypothetical protein O3A20_01345 [Planctomycetota bacterium]|nr:hypothetical protein [Planctomycetota bacterium]
MLAAALALLAQSVLDPLPQQPVEFGAVRWEREYDAARARAQREAKPLLTLFQEVPG